MHSAVNPKDVDLDVPFAIYEGFTRGHVDIPYVYLDIGFFVIALRDYSAQLGLCNSLMPRACSAEVT